MSRSSRIDSCMGDVVAEMSSHPFQAPFHPRFQRAAPCHRAWLDKLPLLVVAKERERGV